MQIFLMVLVIWSTHTFANQPIEPLETVEPTIAQKSDRTNVNAEEQQSETEVKIWETTTVSKRAEPIWSAPGVVSAVGMSEIEAYGATSVGEIWNYLPGMQSTFGTGINRTSVRGGDPNTSNTHVLILVDGRPVRASGGNLSSYSPPYTFPTLQIERIEVSRGPGSVMYGTNAMEGVVNIITRKGQDNNIRTRFESGSFGTRKGEVAGSYSRGDLRVNAGLLWTDIDGWDYESFALDGSRFSKDVLEENRGINLNLQYKNFTITAFHGDMKQFALLAFQDDDPLSFESQVTMLDFAYKKQVGTWNLEAHLTQNHEVFDWLFGDTPVFPLYTNDWLGEITGYGLVGDAIITAGMIVQRLDAGTNGGVVSTPYDGVTTVYSAYTQVQYSPNAHFDLTAGLQYNQIEEVDAVVAGVPSTGTDVDADVVPRLGVVWKFNPESDGPSHGLKLLYGEAFRSPTLLEFVIDTPGYQRGNPNLKPENIETWDLQFFSHGPKYEASLAAYQSVQTDLIIFRRNEEYILGQAQNVARLESEGVEAEFKYKPSKRFFTQAAITWQDNEEKTGLAQASQLPSTNWKLGVGYKGTRFSASLFNQHDGAYKESIVPYVLVLNPPSEAVDIVTVNCDYKLMAKSLGHNMDVGINFRVNNALDEEIWVPDFLGNAINTAPGGAGRAFYTSLRASF